MWGPDQPNNYNGEQNCVVLDGGRGWLWNDVGCNLNYLPWVCQYGKLFSLLLTLKWGWTYIRLFSMDLSVTVSCYFCQPDPPACGSADKNVNTTIESTSSDYSIGHIIKYKCPIDSMIVGNDTRVCQKGGSWNGVAPVCKCMKFKSRMKLFWMSVLFCKC